MEQQLVDEAQRLLAALDIIWCRMGLADEPCTHNPPCAEDPYNDAYQDQVAGLFDKAQRRLDRRIAKLSKRTPGDWQLSRNQLGVFQIGIAATNHLIATLPAGGVNSEGNGLLLAAAPDLLAALKYMYRQCAASGHIDTEPHMVQARAAMERATYAARQMEAA